MMVVVVVGQTSNLLHFVAAHCRKGQGGVGHCGYHRYYYHQGNEQTTAGTVEAAARPWLISNLPLPPYHLIR